MLGFPAGGITRDNFRALNVMDTATWIEKAVDAYFIRRESNEAFAPFAANVAAADNPAQGLGNVFGDVQTPGRAKFTSALALYVQRMPPFEPDIWLFIADLAWRLDASEVVDRVEERLSQGAILDVLVQKNARLPVILLAWMRNISPAQTRDHKPHIKLVRRLVLSGKIPDWEARLTLQRLCAIDPNGWTEHFDLMRHLLHLQMTRIRREKGYDTLRTMQQEFAREIFSIIGADRFAAGLGKLLLYTEETPSVAQDNWLLNVLVKEGIIVGSGVNFFHLGADGPRISIDGTAPLKRAPRSTKQHRPKKPAADQDDESIVPLNVDMEFGTASSPVPEMENSTA